MNTSSTTQSLLGGVLECHCKMLISGVMGKNEGNLPDVTPFWGGYLLAGKKKQLLTTDIMEHMCVFTPPQAKSRVSSMRD